MYTDKNPKKNRKKILYIFHIESLQIDMFFVKDGNPVGGRPKIRPGKVLKLGTGAPKETMTNTMNKHLKAYGKYF